MPRSRSRRQSRRDSRRHHRGGSGCKPLGSSMFGGSVPIAKYAGEYPPTPAPGPLPQTGGYPRVKKGGSMLQSALVPLSLLGMQQYFGRSRKARQSVKGFSRKVGKSVRRVL